MMTNAYLIKARVKYPSTNAPGNLEFIVLAHNTRHALSVLLESSEFPKITIEIMEIENYYGQLVIPQRNSE